MEKWVAGSWGVNVSELFPGAWGVSVSELFPDAWGVGEASCSRCLGCERSELFAGP